MRRLRKREDSFEWVYTFYDGRRGVIFSWIRLSTTFWKHLRFWNKVERSVAWSLWRQLYAVFFFFFKYKRRGDKGVVTEHALLSRLSTSTAVTSHSFRGQEPTSVPNKCSQAKLGWGNIHCKDFQLHFKFIPCLSLPELRFLLPIAARGKCDWFALIRT